MGLSVGELEMISSCPGGIWPNRNEKQCQTFALFSFHDLRCLHMKQVSISSRVLLCDATGCMQVQTTTSMDRNWNMRAHLYDKECNARKNLNLHLPHLLPPQASSRGAILRAMSETMFHRLMQDHSSCHERNHVSPAHARPLLFSILQWLGKHLLLDDANYMAWQLTWSF